MTKQNKCFLQQKERLNIRQLLQYEQVESPESWLPMTTNKGRKRKFENKLFIVPLTVITRSNSLFLFLDRFPSWNVSGIVNYLRLIAIYAKRSIYYLLVTLLWFASIITCSSLSLRLGAVLDRFKVDTLGDEALLRDIRFVTDCGGE